MSKRKLLSADPDYFSKTVDLLFKESDRGAALVAGCLLEEELGQIFRSQCDRVDLTKEDRKYLFDFTGPLGSFSGRVRLARLFGIISRETASDVELIRSFRNDAAHVGTPFSLEDRIHLIDQFSRVDEFRTSATTSLEEGKGTFDKALFGLCVAATCSRIAKDYLEYLNDIAKANQAAIDELNATSAELKARIEGLQAEKRLLESALLGGPGTAAVD